MAKTLGDVYKNVFRCKMCGSLKSNKSGCNNCENNKHKYNKICVVENIADQWSIETSSVFIKDIFIFLEEQFLLQKFKKDELLIGALVERVKKEV